MEYFCTWIMVKSKKCKIDTNQKYEPKNTLYGLNT